MARVNYNVVTHGVSGKVGDLVVFIQRHGKTFLGKIPARSRLVTDDQLAVREKFKKAAKYAKACIQNPVTNALYAEKADGGKTSFNMAFADFFIPPVVTAIDSSNYTGTVGSSISVQATDDTRVKGVKISIMAASNSLVEEGEAIHDSDQDLWVYSATVLNASLAGTKIIAVAIDLPGNTGSAEKLL